jgi:hypothetical protein
MINSFFTNQDSFGVNVAFRYGRWNKKEKGGDNHHKTLFGGIISFLCNAGIAFFFFYYLYGMVTFKGSKVAQYARQPDWRELSID